MLFAFLTTLEQMMRIMLFLLIGFGLNRLRILPKGAGTGISRLVTTVFLPSLLIHSNMTEFHLANIGRYGGLVLLGSVLWLVVTVICIPVSKKLSGGDTLEHRKYLYGFSFPNTSAIGTPLVLALLGTAGLLEFNLFLILWIIMTYAWGINLFLENKQKTGWKRILAQVFNPVFVAMLIGLLLGALDAKNWIPPLAVNLLSDLGSCYVPVSLLMVGYTVAEYPLADVFKRPKSYVFAAIRLILIPAVILLVALGLGFTKSVATLAVLAFACPCGMNVVVFPASYGQDCKTGASIVLISCLGSILTVPVLYALLQQLFQ